MSGFSDRDAVPSDRDRPFTDISNLDSLTESMSWGMDVDLIEMVVGLLGGLLPSKGGRSRQYEKIGCALGTALILLVVMLFVLLPVGLKALFG